MPYALVNPYLTVAELAEELKAAVPVADSAAEDEYKRAIFNASRYVDDYTRRVFYKVTRDDADPIALDQVSPEVIGDKIFLTVRPIIEIASLKIGETALEYGVDYVTNAEHGIIISTCGRWCPSRPDRVITITGTFGYAQATAADVPAAPEHIKFAARLIAAAISGHNRKQVAGLDGAAQSILTNEIPKTVFDILGRRAPILV